MKTEPHHDSQDSIEYTIKNNSKELDLHGFFLNLLPEKIRILTELENIDLSYNRLHSLKPWVGDSRHLITLNLCNNRYKA